MNTTEPDSDDERRPVNEPLMPVVWITITTISIVFYAGAYALYRWLA